MAQEIRSASRLTDSAIFIAEQIQIQLNLLYPVSIDQDLLALFSTQAALSKFAQKLGLCLHRSVSPDVVRAARTPERLGAWLDTTSSEAKRWLQPLITLRGGWDESLPPLLWIHNVDGTVYHRVNVLLKQFSTERRWLGLRDPAGRRVHGAADSVEAHATLLLAALVEAGIDPRIGVIPIGWSFAGRLGWALASQMKAAGWTVPCVVVLDASPWPTGVRPEFPNPLAGPQAVMTHSYSIAARYHAQPAELDLLLLRADESFPHEPWDLGWKKIARTVTIINVPGDHNVFEGDRINTLAASLLAAFECKPVL